MKTTNVLTQAWDEMFSRGMKRNPPPDYNEFFHKLQASGVDLKKFSEDDWIIAARHAGVPSNRVGDFLEELASWL